jgi:hypothetical protein
VPVYNVCLPLLRELDPDRAPIRIVELSLPASPEKVPVLARDLAAPGQFD